ncbi:hypothetical protein JYQ62_05660 [Nostoc sp. UHCC 0702]|nr:hypothetical protein JYQ62_05660 [Nostoc sp. UHCC 0702]
MWRILPTKLLTSESLVKDMIHQKLGLLVFQEEEVFLQLGFSIYVPVRSPT